MVTYYANRGCKNVAYASYSVKQMKTGRYYLSGKDKDGKGLARILSDDQAAAVRAGRALKAPKKATGKRCSKRKSSKRKAKSAKSLPRKSLSGKKCKYGAQTGCKKSGRKLKKASRSKSGKLCVFGPKKGCRSKPGRKSSKSKKRKSSKKKSLKRKSVKRRCKKRGVSKSRKTKSGKRACRRKQGPKRGSKNKK